MTKGGIRAVAPDLGEVQVLMRHDGGDTVTAQPPYPLPEGTRLAPHEVGGGYLYREDQLLLDTRARSDAAGRDPLQQVLAALADRQVRRQVVRDLVAVRKLVPDLPWPGARLPEPYAYRHEHGHDTEDRSWGYRLDELAERHPWLEPLLFRLRLLALRLLHGGAIPLTPQRIERLPHGIVKLILPATRLTRDLVPIVVARLSALEFLHGTAPPQVTPNHVLWGSGHGRPYAVGSPLPAAAPAGQPVEDGGPQERRVRIAVLDGPVAVDHPLFVRPDGTSRIEAESGPDHDAVEGDPRDLVFDGNLLKAYAGHGTFMAGVVVQQAPSAQLLAFRVLRDDGTVDDDELAAAVDRVPADVDIVLMCLGGYAHDNRAMPATAAALEAFRRRAAQTGVTPALVVAAAGNDSVDTELFPAAFADVVGVGAVDAGGAPLCFSNVGAWVDACADGGETTSAFLTVKGVVPEDMTPNCVGVANPGLVDFAGWASWRGTSVAAARFAGAVAAAAAAAGPVPEDSRAVAARLVFLARAGFVPRLGPRV